MPTIADIRTQYPDLGGLDDDQVVDALHEAFYQDLPRERVAASLGVKPPPAPVEPRGLLRTAGDVGISALKGAIGVPEAAVGLANLVTGGQAGKLAEQAGFRPKEAKAMLDEGYSQQQKAAFQKVQAAEGLGDTFMAAVQNPSVIAHSVVESVPSMGAGGVVARGGLALAPKLGGVVAGALGEGVVGAGAAAEQIRQQTPDGLTTGTQNGLAALTGGVTGVFSVLGGKISQKLGIADVDTMLAGAATNPVLRKGVVRSALEGAVSEGILEELPQSVSEQVLQNMALNKPLDEGVNQAAVLGLLSGGAMGAGANVAASFSGGNAPAAGNGVSGIPAAPVDPAAPVVPSGTLTRATASMAPGTIEEIAAANAPAPEPVPAPVEDAYEETINKLPEGMREQALKAYAVVKRDDVAKGVKMANQKLLDGLVEKFATETQEAEEKAQKEPAAPATRAQPAINSIALDSRNVNPETGEIRPAFEVREADRPKQQADDILNAQNKPFTNMGAAKRTATALGDGFAPFKLGTNAFVVRKTGGADVSTSTAVSDVAADTAGSGGAVSPIGMGARVGTGNPAVGTVDAGNVRAEPASDAVPSGNGRNDKAVDVQNTPPAATAKTEAPAIEAPKAGAPVEVRATAAGTTGGSASVEAAGVEPAKFPPMDIRVGQVVRKDGEDYTVTGSIKDGIAAKRVERQDGGITQEKTILLKGDDAFTARVDAVGQDVAAVNIRSAAAKLIPDMSDAEVLALRDHYKPANRRHAKIAQEVEKRGLNQAVAPIARASDAIEKGAENEGSAKKTAAVPDDGAMGAEGGTQLSDAARSADGVRVDAEPVAAGMQPGQEKPGKTGKGDAATAPDAIKSVAQPANTVFTEAAADDARAVIRKKLAANKAAKPIAPAIAAAKAKRISKAEQAVNDAEAARAARKDVLGKPKQNDAAKKPAEDDEPAFSRGTNEAVTNPKDVVGKNQSGRSADDKTPGTDENTGLPLNADGTVTVYHHTSKAAAATIRANGTLKAQAEPDVYVTTHEDTDTGYGDTALPIRIDPARLQIDDEFPSGRKDFRLNVGKPGGSIKVAVANESTASNSDDATMFSRTSGQVAPVSQATDEGRRQHSTEPTPRDLKMGPHEVAAKGAIKVEDGDDVAFSRSNDSAAQNALKALSENETLFALGKSDKTTVTEITAEADADIKVKKEKDAVGRMVYTFTMPDGKTATMSVRPFNNYATEEVPTLYGFKLKDGELSDMVTERPGENPEDVAPTDDVWVDVSHLKGGGAGAAIYNIAETYAHNTGRIFIGDPAGLSDDALRRRTEQMLSSALKFGTTKHLAPHPRQVDGDAALGVPPLKWTYGDDLANIEALIQTTLANYNDVNPITFEPRTGSFVDSEGNELDDGAIQQIGRLGRGGEIGAGLTTLKRGAIFAALVRQEGGNGSGGGQGAGILEKLLVLTGQSGAATKNVFYSRSADPVKAAQSVEQVERTAKGITSRWENAPEVIVAYDMTDPRIPDRVRKQDLEQRSGGATGDPEGFYINGKAYLLASQLKTPQDVTRVLFHESLGHFGLRGHFGGELKPILQQLSGLRRAEVAAKAKEYGLDMSIESQRLQAAEEVLAEMAQKTPEIGFVKRAIAIIRTWLRRNVPGFKNLALTDADIIQQFILPARGWVERAKAADKPAPAGQPAFERKAEQIDSSGESSGNFDPLNPDIRFSRTENLGDAIKSISVTDLKKQGGNWLANYRSLGLQALGGRQINDLYGKDIPQLDEYTRMVQQMSADANEVGANADEIATSWGKLKDEQQLAELMHDATLAQIDPAKDFVPGDNRLVWAKLRNTYEKTLSDEARKVYRDSRDGYEEHYANIREAIREKIERSDMAKPAKAAMLERMDGEFFDKIKGVYFPLSRFGKYVVVTRDRGGQAVNVSRAETLNEADALRVQMRKDFPATAGFAVGKVLKDREFNAARDSVGRGFLKDLFGVLDKEGVGEELQDAVNQLYLASMPDLSWAKHGIHRKGTPGFSQDARRAYAQNMFHGAKYLAKLRYADQLQDSLTDMQTHVEDQASNEGFDSVKGQQVVDELVKRNDSLMNPKSNPLSTALTSFGFVFHLGLSPASAMVNLSQTALVAYPIMGAKWGFDKSAAALAVAGKQAAANKNDISSALTPDERRAYDAAVNAGTIDVTNAHDLAGISQGEDARVSWKLRPVMKWASFLFHHAERFNRQITFVASYRLAREAGASHDAAFEQATKATYDGHFDYAASNRPRVMQGNTAKVVLLFKQFGQNMVYTLVRQAQLAIQAETPEGRKEARKALGGLLVMHAAGAGVLGLPLVTTLLAAASVLGGSDDEPWDAEAALRNMLAETFGQKPAEVMAKGLSRLTPWDISGRVGLDKLIFPDIQEGLEGQRLGESAMAAALGPVAGIGINVLKGMQNISEGRFGLGIEAMMPAALRGPIKAIRYAEEGAKDKSGIVIKDDVGAAGIVGQAMGFSPSEVRNATEGRSAVFAADKRLMERRKDLMDEFARAYMKKDAGDITAARADIASFNEKNPSRQILPAGLMVSVRGRLRRIHQAKEGIYLPKNRQDAREEGSFAIAQ